jgi:hypothetical protein
MASKTVEQIEAEIDQSRNALAVRQLHRVDPDPAPLLLWSQALDNADLALEALRQVGESAALYRDAHGAATVHLQEVSRQRDTAEAEVLRLTRQSEDLFALIGRIDPDELRRLSQARQVDGIH